MCVAQNDMDGIVHRVANREESYQYLCRAEVEFGTGGPNSASDPAAAARDTTPDPTSRLVAPCASLDRIQSGLWSIPPPNATCTSNNKTAGVCFGAANDDSGALCSA